MNKRRRAILAQAVTDIGKVIESVAAIESEEQDTFDLMPESFQSSYRGEQASSMIAILGEALTSLRDASDFISGVI